MAEPERISQLEMLRALGGIKRVCHAGLDSVTLRLEVIRQSAGVLPCEAYALATTDPETGLMTHSIRAGISEKAAAQFVSAYLFEEAERMIDLARSRTKTALLGAASCDPRSHSDSFRQWLLANGLRLDLRAACCDRGDMWGTWCVMRETGAPAFTPREAEFVTRAAPHIGHGLRMAALRHCRVPLFAGTDTAAGELSPPAVAVANADGRIVLRSAHADRYLDDVADLGVGATGTPSAVVSLVGAVHAAHARRKADADHLPLDAHARVRGHSGRWYEMHASLAEPDARRGPAVTVVIAPVAAANLAPLLARLYGLSPREWEVVSLVARGYATSAIAARLSISPYTVQDHVDRACEKIGLRGRRMLLARLFHDTRGDEGTNTRVLSAQC